MILQTKNAKVEYYLKGNAIVKKDLNYKEIMNVYQLRNVLGDIWKKEIVNVQKGKH